MALKKEASREDHNSFVESMLKKAEEKVIKRPQTLYDSVDMERIKELTAEIKSGSTAHKTRKR